jgi:hypothetical protein
VHLPQRAGPGRLVRDDLLDQPEQPEQEDDLAVVAARATAATPAPGVLRHARDRRALRLCARTHPDETEWPFLMR